MAEVNAVKIHTRANIIVTATKVIITKAIMVYITPHIEIINKVITMSLLILAYNIMTLMMVMHSLSKTNIQHYYSKNYKTHTGVYMTLSQTKVIKYLQKWTLRQCHMQCIFQVAMSQSQKLIRSHTRQKNMMIKVSFMPN